MMGMMLRLAKVARSKLKRSPALRKLNGLHVGLVLFAAALFALAYAAEDKAIISLESSQYLFGAVPHQLMYR
jgi:hypothetical protein